MKRLSFITVLLMITGIIDASTPHNTTNINIEEEHTDIVLIMDVSTSMLAEDLSPNRLEAVKRVTTDMIRAINNASIGLTLFAGEAFSLSSLTNQYDSLCHLCQDIDTKIIQEGIIEDGTAIGMGLTSAIGQLSQSAAKNKVAVLFTDGLNNRGEISSMNATELAKIYGVRVFTIAIGTNNDSVSYPLQDGDSIRKIKVPVEVDTQTLQKISNATYGRSYHATNNDELKQVCLEICKQIGQTPEKLPQIRPRISKDNARRLLKAAMRIERMTQKRIKNSKQL